MVYEDICNFGMDQLVITQYKKILKILQENSNILILKIPIEKVKSKEEKEREELQTKNCLIFKKLEKFFLESRLCRKNGTIIKREKGKKENKGSLSGRGPSICCRRPFCRLKAPLGLSLLHCAPQTRILLCKILVGNTQTLELHPVDAVCAIASLIRSNSSQPYIIAHTLDQDVKCRSGHPHLRKQPLHDSFCTGHCSTLFISS